VFLVRYITSFIILFHNHCRSNCLVELILIFLIFGVLKAVTVKNENVSEI